MTIEPKPGLVIRYDYLWREERLQGQEDGKDRPCAIILAAKEEAEGARRVVVCPITHAPLGPGDRGFEIPAEAGRRLGLDHERSFLKTHEVNVFTWEKDRIPFGVTPLPSGAWSYGVLPHALARRAFDEVREQIAARKLASVDRDLEPDPGAPRRKARP